MRPFPLFCCLVTACQANTGTPTFQTDELFCDLGDVDLHPKKTFATPPVVVSAWHCVDRDGSLSCGALDDGDVGWKDGQLLFHDVCTSSDAADTTYVQYTWMVESE